MGRVDCVDDVVSDAGGYRFVERTLLAIRPQVVLERARLDAAFVRPVPDFDGSEIWLSSQSKETSHSILAAALG